MVECHVCGETIRVREDKIQYLKVRYAEGLVEYRPICKKCMPSPKTKGVLKY